MKKLLFAIAVAVCLAISFSTNEVGGEMPNVSQLLSDRAANFSPTPTPPLDLNERSWERWWRGNRAPLLVDLTPAFKAPVIVDGQPTRTPTSYEVFPSKKPKSIVSEDKVNTLQILVLLGYGGDFKEITREMALTELEARGDKALDELIEIASGRQVLAPIAGMSSRQLRNYAVLALGEIKSPKSFDALVEAFNKGEQETQFFAAVALGRLGDKRAVKVLTDNAGARNQFHSPAVCLSLGMLGAFEGFDFMKQTFQHGGANEERLFAALSLGMLGAKDPRKTLIEIVKNGSDPLEKALAGFIYLSFCEPKSNEPAAVASLLEINDDFTRVITLMGMGILMYRDNLDRVFDIAKNMETTPEVAKAAMLMLAMSNSKDGNTLLVKLRDSLQDELKAAAEFALDLMETKKRTSILDNWSVVKDKQIRLLMPFVLVRYLGEPAVVNMDRAVKLVHDYNPGYLALAYGWAFEVGKPAPISKVLTAEKVEHRACAIAALAVSRTNVTVDMLTKLGVPDGPEQMALNLSLKAIAPNIILKFFRDNPQRGNPRVCVGIATALGGLQCEGVEDELDQYISFYHPDVRCYAYLAMGRLGTKAAADRLIGRYGAEKHPFALGNLILAAGFLLRQLPQDKDMLEIVRGGMYNTAHGEARAYASLAWGVSHDINRFDMIGSIFGTDRDPRVMSAAALAFGLSEHESSVFSLRRALEVKSYKQVREFGCFGLGVLKNRDTLNSLLDMVKDKDNDVRIAATVSIGAMRDNACKGIVKPLAESDGSMSVRRLASVGLMLLEDGYGFECFINSFKGRGDEAIREMGWVELTEVSNLYMPVGFKIDDYLQDLAIPEEAEEGTKK